MDFSQKLAAAIGNAYQPISKDDHKTDAPPQGGSGVPASPQPMCVINTFIPTDSCCDRQLSAALAKGKLPAKESWVCPRCGVEWGPRMVEGVRMWEASIHVAIFR